MSGSQSRQRKPSSGSEEGSASPGAARLLILCVLVLFAFSITMLFSIGIGQKNPLHYPLRQLAYAVVAAGGCVFTAFVPPLYWKKLMPLLCVMTIILLLMARFAGRDIAGAHRWLSLGPVNFQPSELAKLSAILWVSTWLSVYRRRASEFVRGFLLPAAGLGVLCMMVLIGPDFGTTMLIGGTGILVMYIGGTRIIYLLGSAIIALTGLGALIMQDKERLSRITSFTQPEKYAADDAYQLMASLLAFIKGGLTGDGIGRSLQKFDYLPEAHTDFILAILAEELGLVGTCTVMLLYLTIFACGMMISMRCKDSFSRLLGFGITILIFLQSVINVGVVTGSMPTKGLPLPFVSYGGSSLVFMAAMVGILVRISRGNCSGKDEKSRRLDGQQWI
ncbi:putative lipid II flippase FtsW [Kiritimatiellaeota bacterium B1221]|nr:putative lipid II flippase FtsW [Kiritimatiellaeota bacterium B1221]